MLLGQALRSSVVLPVSFLAHSSLSGLLLKTVDLLAAVREQLLWGLLSSDLLGFQTHNYARHFRQTCSRILSLEALPKGIQLEHSFVDVAVFPIGIDVADLDQKRLVHICLRQNIRCIDCFIAIYRQNLDVGEWAKSIRQRYEGKKLIVGRDKLDEVSVGFPSKKPQPTIAKQNALIYLSRVCATK